jgi:hypothetical protein
VRPITHDNFNAQIDNFFRRPDLRERFEIEIIAGTPAVEIISPFNVTGTLQYTVRYIKYPDLFILGNLTTLFQEIIYQLTVKT